jgi:hypothetical protein
MSSLRMKIQYSGVPLFIVGCNMQTVNISITVEVRGHFPGVIFGCVCVRRIKSYCVDERPCGICCASEKCRRCGFHWSVAEAGD